jgi:hypothetical protein
MPVKVLIDHRAGARNPERAARSVPGLRIDSIGSPRQNRLLPKRHDPPMSGRSKGLFELSQFAEDPARCMEQQFALWRCRIHLSGQRTECDAAFLETGHRCQQM